MKCYYLSHFVNKHFLFFEASIGNAVFRYLLDEIPDYNSLTYYLVEYSLFNGVPEQRFLNTNF